MELPEDFKNIIANTFYDKTLIIYSTESVKDDEGFATSEATTTNTYILGNVRFDKLDKVALDYGITDKIDMTVTTNDVIDAGTILGYGNNKYKVLRSIPFDSHYLLIASLWLQKS